MKKSIITLIVFTLTTFVFSYETKAFAKALMIEQPAADSCYEITLKSGQKIYANIKGVDTKIVKYRYCGDEETTPILTIEKSQIADIKTITTEEGENKHYSKLKKEQNQKRDKRIYILYAISLGLLFLLLKFGFFYIRLGIFLLILLFVFTIWTLVTVIKHKEKLEGKGIIAFLSVLQLILAYLLSLIIIIYVYQ